MKPILAGSEHYLKNDSIEDVIEYGFGWYEQSQYLSVTKMSKRSNFNCVIKTYKINVRSPINEIYLLAFALFLQGHL